MPWYDVFRRRSGATNARDLQDITQFAKGLTKEKNGNFSIDRAKQMKQIYSDETSVKNWIDSTITNTSSTYTTAAALRNAINSAITNRDSVVQLSKKLYATNPIYASIIDYLSNISMWRYKVTPHKIYTKSAKQATKRDEKKFMEDYNLMLEVVDGLSLETKCPSILAMLLMNGGVYFTTYNDEETLTLNTIILPDKYCKKVGETQYGTAIVSFNMSFFDELGLDADQLKALMKGFPKEFQTLYNKYKKNSQEQWAILDPFYSSGILLNEYSIPTLAYLYGAIINYEKYQDNELERNGNLLKYLVVQEMPVYQDTLVFEPEEVRDLHQSMKNVIEKKNNNVNLITTYGQIHVEHVAEESGVQNQTLLNAFKNIFNTAGLNSGIFADTSVTSLQMSLVRDKAHMKKYVDALLNFYSITINNWYQFKEYQVDIEILPISPYTYNEDIKIYKDNATLGVGKLDYFIASGIKQKNIGDQLYLEEYLGLNEVKPMQTSFTQTGENAESSDSNSSEDSKTSTGSPSSENSTAS